MADGSLFDRFVQQCDALLPPKGTLLIAVSGGADSMALWELLARTGRFELVVFHLDHGLRFDAHLDAKLIESARAQGLAAAKLIVEACEVPELAKKWRCGVESAGRRQRYDRLKSLAVEHKAAAVLTAHHRDDQAETVLANLLRGAGPVGRSGIPPQRMLAPGVPLIRPLLPFTRDELRFYLKERGIRWREDETNGDQRFTRNWLRHSVLPQLEQVAPGFTGALADLAEDSRIHLHEHDVEAERLWAASYADERLLVPPEGTSEEVRYLLWRRLLKHLELPIERRHLHHIDNLARGELGRKFVLGGVLFHRGRDRLIWQANAPRASQDDVLIAGQGSYHRGNESVTVLIADPPRRPESFRDDSAVVDADKIQLPLTWRLPHANERWHPLGLPGTQTVVKFLAERKVPSQRRMLTPVIADCYGIVWIPGCTIAERARVSETTQRALLLTRIDTVDATLSNS